MSNRPDKETGIQKTNDWYHGPGNMFIDAAVKYRIDAWLSYDRDAARGKVSQEVVNKSLDYHFCLIPIRCHQKLRVEIGWLRRSSRFY